VDCLVIRALLCRYSLAGHIVEVEPADSTDIDYTGSRNAFALLPIFDRGRPFLDTGTRPASLGRPQADLPHSGSHPYLASCRGRTDRILRPYNPIGPTLPPTNTNQLPLTFAHQPLSLPTRFSTMEGPASPERQEIDSDREEVIASGNFHGRICRKVKFYCPLPGSLSGLPLIEAPNRTVMTTLCEWAGHRWPVLADPARSQGCPQNTTRYLPSYVHCCYYDGDIGEGFPHWGFSLSPRLSSPDSAESKDVTSSTVQDYCWKLAGSDDRDNVDT
jgi:hypothetical protein